MRIILILGIIGTLFFYSIKWLRGGENPLGGWMNSGMTGVVGTVLPKVKGVPPPEPAASVSASPASAAGVLPDASGAYPGKKSVTGADGLPLVPPVTGFYTFQLREPPAVADLQSGATGLTVTLDKVSRTLSVCGPPDAVSSLLSLCSTIDVLGGSCAVQTWAVYVDKTAQKGFDLTAALRAVAEPGIVGNFGTFGSGGFVLNISAGEITAALAVIADGSTVEVVQRPHVRLSHGTVSRIESIQEVPIPVSVVSNGISQGSVQFRKVGLQLEVTPFFMSRDLVRLAVKQTNGILGDSVEIQGSPIPIIQSQTVETTTDLTMGQAVVLGGVSTKRKRIVRGLLRNTEEVSEGALYVILSTYSDIPKALRLDAPVLEYPQESPVPFAVPMESPADWIDGQLLPAKNWEKDENEFVRARGAK